MSDSEAAAPPAEQQSAPDSQAEAAGPPAPALIPRDDAALDQARRIAGTLVKSNNRQQYASSAVFANFREVRGGAIAPRRLYRSSHPALDGDPRFPYAQQLAENARLRGVINLADSPQRAAALAANIPWYQNFINRRTIATLEMGTDYTAPAFLEKLAAALRFIITHDGPWLIHGNAGLERTGFVALVIEALMGAGTEEIVTDYLTSYMNYYRLDRDSDACRALAAIPEELILVITERRDPASLDLREAAEAWLRERAGLTAEEVAALRRRLAE